jgi:2-iminobutanoate/2-iminopropanoate deaminase
MRHGSKEMARESVTTDKIAAPVGPFSPAVRAAQDPTTGRLIEGDVAAQTALIFKNVEAVLAAARKTFADVIKASVYLTDMRDFAAMNAVYGRHFEPPYPARTTVTVASLPLGAAVRDRHRRAVRPPGRT